MTQPGRWSFVARFPGTRPSLLLATGLALGLLSAAGAGPLPAQDAPVPTAEAVASPGTFLAATQTGTTGERTYLLYVPSGYDSGSAVPLLVYLHGCTQDAFDASSGTRFNALAEETGMLVLYPEQAATVHPQSCWQWYEPSERSAGEGEVGLLADMIETVRSEYAIDQDRIYVAGVSAGAAMALALASAHPRTFAAVGVHSGLPYPVASSAAEGWAALAGTTTTAEELSSRIRDHMVEPAPEPIPLIVFHGGNDALVAPSHARLTIESWLGAWSPGDAHPGPTATDSATAGGYAYQRARWKRDGRLVAEEWIVEELGHMWSGGDARGSYTDPAGPDAAREMLRFFTKAAGRDEHGGPRGD